MGKSNSARIVEGNIDHSTGCWIATSHSIRKDGYPKIGFGGKQHLGMRAVWLAVKGEIPQKFELLHSCDVRACVNVFEHIRIAHTLKTLQTASQKAERHVVNVAVAARLRMRKLVTFERQMVLLLSWESTLAYPQCWFHLLGAI